MQETLALYLGEHKMGRFLLQVTGGSCCNHRRFLLHANSQVAEVIGLTRSPFFLLRRGFFLPFLVSARRFLAFVSEKWENMMGKSCREHASLEQARPLTEWRLPFWVECARLPAYSYIQQFSGTLQEATMTVRLVVRWLGLTLILCLCAATGATAKKAHAWQRGKLLDTDRAAYFVGTLGSSNTTGNVYDSGNTGTYSGDTSSSQIAIHRVYQTYVVEGADRVYVAKQLLRWRWSKAAHLAVNSTVQYAVEGHTMYLLDGNEPKARVIEARIVKEILKPSGPAPFEQQDQRPASLADKSACTVSFKSTPDAADINLDGKFVGDTPSILQLVPGDHAIAIEKAGFKSWHRTVELSPGCNVTIDATLEKP